MTTEAIPTEMSRVREDGTTQQALDAPAMDTLLRDLHGSDKAKDFFCKVRGTDGEGTGTVGLYVEMVCTTPGRESHSRYFVVGPHVYLSHREKGMVKANWRHKAGASLEAALRFIDKTLARDNVHLYGRVLLVELEADSVSQIETGQLPSARFRGQYRIERDYGKYEFGAEIRSSPIPPMAATLLATAQPLAPLDHLAEPLPAS